MEPTVRASPCIHAEELEPLPKGCYWYEKYSVVALARHLCRLGYRDIYASVWPDDIDRKNIPRRYSHQWMEERFHEVYGRLGPLADLRAWRDESYKIYYDAPGTTDLVARSHSDQVLLIDAKGTSTRSVTPGMLESALGGAVLLLGRWPNSAVGVLLPETPRLVGLLQRLPTTNPVTAREDVRCFLVEDDGYGSIVEGWKPVLSGTHQ